MDAAQGFVQEVAKHHRHIEPAIHQHISHFGQNVLWVTTIAFFISFLIFSFKTASLPSKERANAYTTLFIVGFATLSYYSMATGLGLTEGRIFGHTYRQLFFARYIDWTFTTPLLLLDLVLISGLDIGTTLLIVGADVGMIITGLFGALEAGVFKWGWFLAGCAFLVVVMVGLLQHGRKAAFARNSEIGNLYAGLSGYLLVLWWAYPVVWFLSEGKGRISSDVEVLIYAVLDVLAKIAFSIWIFVKHPIIADASAAAGGILDEPLLGTRGLDSDVTV